MPGRLAIYDDNGFKSDAKNLIKQDLIKSLNPRYNIAPTTAVPTLLNSGEYLYTHFGYLPSWAKSKKSMNINARSESIFEKMTFRDSFKFRRCLIPINGFYEWEIEDKTKKPYFVKDIKNDYFALAGIWDEYFDIDLNTNIITIALITCDANDKLKKIHHRMPVVIEPKDFSNWLYNNNLNEVNKLFNIYSSEKLDLYEVTTNVNKVSFDNISCVQKIIKKEIGQQTLF